MIDRSSSTVSKWEKGDQLPEPAALNRLSQCLGIPAAWFLKRPPNYGEHVCFYRSNASVTKEAQNIALVRLKWLNEVSVALQHWIEWPLVNIPVFDEVNHLKITDSDIEEMALACRQAWNLGLGPISDMVLALENAGVVCMREELGFARMDGASRWFDTDNRPYVFLAADKANGVRNRFDAAHELGHLVLHRYVNDLEFARRYKEIERQAHLFAAAFLMPAESFAAEVMRPSLDTFLALKPRWKVSVAAMIMRCHQLQITDDDYNIRLWKNYSARGWRSEEPLDDKFDFEPIRLLPRAVKLLLDAGGLTKDALLSALGMSATDCELLCGLPAGFFRRDFDATHARLRLKAGATEENQDARIIPFPIRSQS